jgi:hypothetical protein
MLSSPILHGVHPEADMLDRYSKVVLTIIAAALSAIAIEQAAPPAHAQPEASATCGDFYNACYVRTREPLDVRTR